MGSSDKKNIQYSFTSRYFLIALLICAVATGGIAWAVARYNRDVMQEAVKLETQRVVNDVRARFQRYQYGLRGARGVILTAGSHDIRLGQFRRYSESRDIEVEFPGAEGFGFIRRVPQNDESAFLTAARKDGQPNFAIHQFQPHDGERFVIQYVEPIAQAGRSIGLDIASEANRRLAAESAMRSGEARLTGPITLVSHADQPGQSYLMLLPIYQTGATPATEAERQASAIGWSYTFLSTRDVLNGLWIDHNSGQLELQDITDATHPITFFQTTPSVDSAPIGLSYSIEQNIYGRIWRITLNAYPPFVSNLHLVQVNTVVLIGALLSILLAVFVEVWRINRQNHRKLYDAQVLLAAIVESSHDGIIGKTLSGVITSWNRGAEYIFGYTAQEALGKSVAELIVPPDLQAEEADILAHIRRGEEVHHYETRRRCKDGRLIDVSVSVAPIRNADGLVVGASKTVRDISEQRANHNRILELNASLEQQVEARTAEIRTYSALQQAILTNADCAIIATDTAGIVSLFNPAAERMLAYRAEEIIGKLTPAVFHDPEEMVAQAASLAGELGETVAPGLDVFQIKSLRGLPNERQWTYIRKNGSRFPVLLTISTLRNEDGIVTGFLFIAYDMTVREEHRRNLESTRDQLLKAAEVAELGIWSWRLADNTIEGNERICEIYDIPPESRRSELYYAHWRSCVHPDDFEMLKAKFKGTILGTDIYDPVFRIVRLDGEIRYIQSAALVERDADGHATKMLGISRDITEQHEQEDLLRTGKIAADAASRAKSEFLANMSHEIRTPMNAILGMLQLLKHSALDPRQFDYADKATTAASALLSIINDILDFSRVEAGKLTLDLHPFSIDQLLRDVSSILSANVGEKNIDILFEIDPALPKWIVADSLRLQQILINLSGNAVKFTEHGEVVLSVQLLEQNQSRLKLAFAIRDTGIGISEEQCQHIFDGFSQAETSTARRYGGSGLGLAISQRLVRLMGGRLCVESTLGQGSTFSFHIDCQIAAHAMPADAENIVSFRSMNCLVVDDNASARELLAAALASFGWHADVASSGEEALDLVTLSTDKSHYDVVFVDWRMPGLDGWETCKRIRCLFPADASPVIIMVTAYGGELMVQRMTGEPDVIDGTLVKPVTASMLFDAVIDASTHRGHEHQRPNTEDGQQQRLAGLHILVVEDNPTNQLVARDLLAYEGAQVEVADCGRTAIDMVKTQPRSFDVILMDIQMPEMDGYLVTRLLREQFPADELPIIAMTANVMPSDKEAALASGMNDHVGKPFNLSHLVKAILNHVKHRPTLQTAPVSTRPIMHDGASMARPGWNGLAAIDRLDGNIAIYRKTLLIFSEDAKDIVKRLETSPTDPERNTTIRELHTLKGLAATVGAEELADMAAKAEQAMRDADSVWPEDMDALLAATHQAITSAMELAIELNADVHPLHEVDNNSPLDLKGDMMKLIALLDESNLDALKIFSQLQQRYHAATPTEFVEIAKSIGKLDFAAASRWCTAILQQH